MENLKYNVSTYDDYETFNVHFGNGYSHYYGDSRPGRLILMDIDHGSDIRITGKFDNDSVIENIAELLKNHNNPSIEEIEKIVTDQNFLPGQEIQTETTTPAKWEAKREAERIQEAERKAGLSPEEIEYEEKRKAEWEAEQDAERRMSYGPDEDEAERIREAERRANHNPEEEAMYSAHREAERIREAERRANHNPEEASLDEKIAKDDEWVYEKVYGGGTIGVDCFILSHSFGDKKTFFELADMDEYGTYFLTFYSNEQEKQKHEDSWANTADLHTHDTDLAKNITENITKYLDSHFEKTQNVNFNFIKKNIGEIARDVSINTNNLALISDTLTSGISQTVENKELGEIYVDKGLTGKSGYGLQHIIEDRSRKDKFGEDEISALLCKVVDSVQNGKIAVEQPKIINGRDVGRIGIEKDGIIGFVSKVRDDKDEKFVITGFAINEKKEEAAEAIQAVIAQYGSTPAFSDIRKQVGAVVSSLQQVSPQMGEKSSGPAENDKPQDRQIEAAKKAGYVQGVCECIAAIGDDHALGKKLLTEMHVTKDQAKKYAKPETYKALEQGIFAQKQEQKIKQKQGVRR